MKTTLDLSDELLIRAKQKAAEQRRPLRALVEEGLRLALGEIKDKPRRKQVTLVTTRGGLAPDLDLSTRKSMYAWVQKHR